MANYRITAQDDLAAGGAKTKAKQNIAAISLLKRLETEQRQATLNEQSTLVGYSGWGAAPDIFTGKDTWSDLQGQLKELLTDEEYAAARASTLNAHYTDPVVVDEIYIGLERLGFTGGRVLDPSMGASGMFEGMMPEAIAQNSKITGIELDSISGRIAGYLYPEAIVHVNGFQDVDLPDDYFDLTISNVPFSEVGVADPDYNGLPVKTLHDYFFAKGLDKVRPGGIVAYITSTGTMQSARGVKFREYLSEQANLVGAVRLPGDAFKKIAGTEVTTDIVILQKLGNGVEPNSVSWTKLLPTSVLDTEGKAISTNEYFVNNPQMMLGTLADDKLHPGRLAMKSDGRDIAEAIGQAFKEMPTGVYQQTLAVEEDKARTLVPPELQTTLKQNAYTLYEGQLMVRERSYLEPVNHVGKRLERAIGLIAIRDATERVLNVQLQDGTSQELNSAQGELNRIYDKFVKAHGYVSGSANKAVFHEDPSYPLLRALENYDREEKTATKTDIFSKRTIQPYVAKEQADTAKEGLLYSLNELGKVDIDYISELVGTSEAEAVTELQKDGLIFLDPISDEWQTQDEYLSGNVRQKLEDAIAAVDTGDSQFSSNVEALKAVQPETIPPGDIDVRLGSTWIPSEDVQAFVTELLEADVDGVSVHHSAAANTWYVNAVSSVSSSAANTNIHGTSRRPALTLVETALNLKTPIVYDYDRDGSRTLNVEDTAAAKLKFEEIREKFKNWVWQDPVRTERLTALYNDKFNRYRERQFSGDHLELPGKNQQITLRPHQKNAVWRSLSGNALFAHAVGAGKTFSMIASAMEQKRLGLAQKPMMVVPNHLLEQISADCKLLYPASNVLAATKKDSSKQNRQHLMARIATGNWDIVLVTHSAFGKLRLSDQMQTDFYQEAFDEVEEAIRGTSDEGDNSRRLMKDLEKRRDRLKNKIKEIADNPAKDNTVDFEQLGVDLLVVDESHYFKNLGYTTKMRDVAGLPNTESGRAFDMYMKVRYMAKVRGEGKGVIFATGTPVTNSIAELYTIQRYLQLEVLRGAGVNSFDDWASTFGDTITAPELTPAGEFRVKTRFAQFVNMPELMTMCRQMMDVQTLDMLDLPVPQLAGGKPTVVAVPATDEQLMYMESIVERAKNLSDVDPSEDNMLLITGDGRKMSATMKLLDLDTPDDPDSKLSRLVEDTTAYWHEHQGEKTHLIFCDLGTPKTTGIFSIYKYVKEKCIEKGVPVEKIAFAQDANSDAQKLDLQKKFNSGEVAILIGGASIETGFNGQRRLGRVSHFTVPWRPDQIEQRDGRGLRQGNRNSEVESFRYTTQGRNGQIGIDGYLWKTLKTKKIFADQAMKGDTTQRRISDISTDALSYSELEGIATGNPLIMEKATIDNEIAQLSIQKRAHTNNQYNKRKTLAALPERIQSAEVTISSTTNDLTKAKAAMEAGTVTLWGRKLEIGNVEEIGKQIRSRAAVINKIDESIKERIGELGELSLFISNKGYSTELGIEGDAKYWVDNILQSKQGAYNALFGITDRMEKSIHNHSQRLSGYKQDLEALSKDADNPFAKEAELQTALKRQAEIYAELDSIGKDKASDKARVTAGKDQPDALTRRIANFLEHADIHAEVREPDGFALALKNEESGIPVEVDAANGTALTIKSEVTMEDGHTKAVTATFSISSEGILAATVPAEREAERSPLEDIEQLAHYLARNIFTADIQIVVDEAAGEAIAQPASSLNPRHDVGEDKEATQSMDNSISDDYRADRPGAATIERGETQNTQVDSEPGESSFSPAEKPQSEADKDRVFERIQDSKLGLYVANFIVKHGLRQEVLSDKETSTLFEGIGNKAPTTITTAATKAESLPQAPSEKGSQILTVDSDVDWLRSKKVRAVAKFLVTQSGRLQMLEISSPTPGVGQNMSSLHLESQLGVYLALNKLTRVSETVERVDSVQSSPSLEVEPSSEAKDDRVVLTLKSLSSGEESEVVLPSMQEMEKAPLEEQHPLRDGRNTEPLKSVDSVQAAPPEAVKADETTIYKTETIAVTRNIERSGIEVRFAEKPSTEWTDRLGRKGEKMRFTSSGGDPRWHKREARVSIENVLKIAQEYHTAQTAEKPAIAPETLSADDTIEKQTVPAAQKEKSVADGVDNSLRPAFKRYLETKEEYPNSIVFIRSPGTYLEAYQDDAVLVASLLDIRLSKASSNSAEYGRVNVSRIFQSSADEKIAKLQQTYPVAVVKAEGEITVYPQIETEVSCASVKWPEAHTDGAERNASQLVHDAGLASTLTKQKDFRLKIENGSLSPLRLECYDIGRDERMLILSQYVESAGEKVLDCEAVFIINPDGEISLEETASQNPLGSGELRERHGGDRGFATAFTKNILEDGFAEAAIRQCASAEEKQKPSVKQFTDAAKDRERGEGDRAQANREIKQRRQAIKAASAPKVRLVEQQSLDLEPALPTQPDTAKQNEEGYGLASSVIQRAIAQHEPQLHSALVDGEATTSAGVEILRDWYCAVKDQNERDDAGKAGLLKAISEKGREASMHGSTQLTAAESKAMEADIDRFTASRPEVNVGNLRSWYRANTAIASGTAKEAIEKLARDLQDSGKASTPLRPTDYVQMEKEIALQDRVAAEIEPNLRAIWNVVSSSSRVVHSSNGESTCRGEKYTIKSNQAGILNLSRNDDGREISIARGGDIIKNQMTMEDAQALQTVVQELAKIPTQRQPSEVQA